MKNCRHWCCVSSRVQSTSHRRDKCAVCSSLDPYSTCLQCAGLHCVLHYRPHGRLAGHHLSLLLNEEGVWCEKCGKKVVPDDKKTTDLVESCIARIQRNDLNEECLADGPSKEAHQDTPQKKMGVL
jgi:hypothetical protein